MKKLLFVYNPHSGKGRIGDSLSDILCTFTGAGYNVTAHPTSYARDGENFIKQHAKEFNLVVVGGGDGMLHELFCGLIGSGTEVPCGYIPAGTINDFASSLNIPKSPKKAAKTAVSENYRTVDAGLWNGNIFSYVSAFGMFTDVGYSTDQKMKNALGPFAYYLDVLKEMDIKNLHNSSVHASLQVNGEVYEDDFIFALAGNTRFVAGLTSLIPEDASMEDGLLDYAFVRTPKSLPELDKIRNTLLTRSFDPDVIISGKASSLTVKTDKPVKWTLDGELGGEVDTADISVIKSAVKIAVS
ncbi:MAG: YegS/Rv2252/BmrU family lipid kinase [Clostridia bacterium]|nr:YegS/Rv2252/BmrU family lipid kinase [Clostridia bacterium]